ncbi:putative polyadenylate-binding protein-interacting protein [Dioscorea sansibarensis]
MLYSPFDNYNRMMARKSVLNPYAAPYVPLSEMFSGMSFEEKNKAGKGLLGESEKNTANCLVAGSTSSYGIQHAVKPDNFEELPTKIGQQSGSPDTHTLPDGTAEYEDFGGMNDHAMMMETLSSLYPDISVESLAEVLYVNNGNLNEAIDMLEQFEYEGFDSGDFPETSEARNNFDPISLEGSSSGTNNTI